MERTTGAAGLGRFVSRLAASWLSTDPETRHRRLEGSLVSADLSGFTALSEALARQGRRGAEDLTKRVNACFTLLIGSCAAEQGDVLKFGGDAVLVWFADEGHAERAVRAAARMQRAVRSPKLRGAGLRLSIGVRSGPADLFLVGRSHLDLVVCGPAASEAVRLETTAAAGQVLVSPATAAALPASWVATGNEPGVPIDLDAVRPVRGDQRAEIPDGEHLDRLLPPGLVHDVRALAHAGGEHRLATIAFLGLEEVDFWLAADGPDAVANDLQNLVSHVQATAARYGATFLYSDVAAGGLKLLVAAGAPTTTGQDEEAVLRFATDVVHGHGGPPLRAGINRGQVFAGFLGSPDRRTYTVMGDPVNVAARLMARAGGGDVLVSDDVLSRSRTSFEATSVAPFLVRGRTQPVSAHVVGRVSGARPSARTFAEFPFVGRANEIAVLRGAVADAVRGHGRVVEIAGDAGIGKTRLLAAMADDPGLLVRLTVECQPYDSLSAYAGLQPLIRQALGIAPSATAADARSLLTERVNRSAPELAGVLPLLAVPFGAEIDSTAETDAIAAEFRAARIHDAVADLLGAVLRSTTLLVVEDVYYIDDASLQLLRVIASRAPAHPWVLCVTKRPEGPGVIVGDVEGTLLKLGPLESDEAARLAEYAAADRVVGLSEVPELVDRAGGNPLFVLELVEASGSGMATENLPESIERLVAVRIDRLAPGDRMVLRQAAVVGRSFSIDVINALLVSEGLTPAGTEPFVRMDDFVEPLDGVDGGGLFQFRHALFRDVAYAGLPYELRRQLHAGVGGLLEAGVGGAPAPSLLSLHFWLGANWPKAWHYSVEAGAEAWNNYAITESIACYRRALDARRHLRNIRPEQVAEVAEALGDALERAARYDEAEDAYRLARRSGIKLSYQHARLMRKIGILCEHRGQYGQALRWYQRGMKLVNETDRTRDIGELAELQLAYAGVRHRQGRHGDVAKWASRAEERASAISDARTTAYALNLKLLAANYGGGGDGREFGLRGLVGARACNDVQLEGKLLNNLGTNAYFRGDWVEAQQRWESAAEAFRRAGDMAELANAMNNQGEVLSDQGHLERAIEAFEAAKRSFESAHHAYGAALVTSNLGRAAVRRGRVVDAESLLAEAQSIFETIGAHSQVVETIARRCEALLAGGQSEAAARLALEAMAGTGNAAIEPATEAGLHRALGWARLQAGRYREAADAFTPGLALAERNGLPFEAALTMVGLAMAARFLDDPRAEAYEAESARTFERLGVVAVPHLPLLA